MAVRQEGRRPEAQAGIPHALTDLAGQAIRDAKLPGCFGDKVIVLFDAYYLCPKVVDACQARGWHYIGAGKGNRNFHANGQWHKLGGKRGSNYGRNVLSRGGTWHTIQGIKSKYRYRVAERVGRLKKLGEVKVVFSKRKGDGKVIALVTDDLHAAARSVVAHYLR